MSFVFYDTETTGTNTAFDQILQFGAILTDDQLQELERFEIRCRLLPDIIASPAAMRVTGVTIEQLTDPTLPSHYQMVKVIREQLIKWSPSIFIGHNSLNFDEYLLRQAFYKTLHPPYLTNTNGNGRHDSLRMIRAVALFAPESLVIPEKENGKQIFKLDQLAPENGFAHENAHDAMADVEATIYMCRLIAEKTPHLWADFIHHAQKANVSEYIHSENIFCLTDFYYGKHYSWLVTAIEHNPNNGAEILAFDLTNDPGELKKLSDEDLRTKLASRPRIVRSIRLNAGPIIRSYDDAPAKVCEKYQGLEVLEERAALIKQDTDFQQRLITVYLDGLKSREPSPHVEDQIYNGFTSNSDHTLLAHFHKLDWKDRPDVLKSLTDQRMELLGRRLIYSEAPELLSATASRNYEIAIANRLMAEPGTVPWLTLPQALKDVIKLLDTASGKEAKLLQGHYDWLVKKTDWATAIL